MVRSIFIATALATSFVVVGASPVLSRRAVSNAATSLTFLYQNNLNATDDANHVGAILLDEMPYSQAPAACAMIGEVLLDWATIQAHTYDFERQLAYQSFIGKSKPIQRYYIASGQVVSATQAAGSLQIVEKPSRDIALPVLCTQSSNGNNPYAAATDSNKITVGSNANTFTGFRNQKSFRFLGIPYVAQPERFTYSKYPSASPGEVDATKYGMQCAQPYQAPGTTSENCLFLNIQTPYIPKAGSNKKSDLRPVHFWIHGGGWTGGTGSDAGTDGGNMASREDYVTVTINYRLSTLGFLAIPGTDIHGNFAFGDMINALKWTIDNIAAFGGDPDRIVINGESAGAGSVRVLLGSPPAQSLFQGAIAMSGLGFGLALDLGYAYSSTYSDYLTIEGSYNIAGQQIFNELGCSEVGSTLTQQIACLKQVDPVALVSTGTVARYPVQDGYFINTEHLILENNNGSTAHIDVMFGVSQDEGSSLITYPRTPVNSFSEGLQASLGIDATNAAKVIASGLFPLYDTGNITLDSFNVSARIATDLQFRCMSQATLFAGDASGAFKSAHGYQMRRTYWGYDPNNLGGPAVTPGYPYGNPNLPYFRVHSSEVANCFGNLDPLRDANDLYTIQLSSGYWAEFIKSGTPNPPTRYLTVRGYDKTIEAITKTGRWDEIRNKKGPILLIDYPAVKSDFVDLEQCAWLGFPVDYYHQ
ncbi:Acetylcholinesterase [Dactylellina cionopaga]|nr:Acetylcholinesterase [Dactylellina cionopaga]